MMRFELGLEPPDRRAGGSQRSHDRRVSYVIGGLIPLAPYMSLPERS